MKRLSIFAVGAALLLSSCGSYTASGAYTGSSLGSILGSAIGGLTGGPRGSDWGTIIGMAGGAVVGSAIGSAAEQSRRQQIDDYHRSVQARSAQRDAQYGDYGQRNGGYGQEYGDSGFDPQNGGDDRIDWGISGAPSGNGTTLPSQPLAARPGGLVISNVRYLDQNGDQMLGAGEVSKIAFDLKNTSQYTLYNVQPIVVETTGNRHVLVSPTINVESIAPGSGIRYTATVVAERGLRRGAVAFRVSAETSSGQQAEGATSFRLQTKR